MDDLIIINRPIQEVFDYLTDHSNDKHWKPFVTESRKVTTGPIGVGTRFEIVTVAGKYRRAGEVEIIAYEPDHMFAYRAHDRYFPFVSQLMFSTTPSGTRIHGHVEFQAQGVWKLLSALPLLFFRSQTKRTFFRLKQVIEGTAK
jgi:uncharacterized protein YndB with AHSA1/START domain